MHPERSLPCFHSQSRHLPISASDYITVIIIIIIITTIIVILLLRDAAKTAS